MNINKFIISILTVVLSFLLAIPLGKLYKIVLDLPEGFYSFAVPAYMYNFFNGIFPAYIFFLPLLFTAFGGKQKYWWIGILLIPAAAVELYLDATHVYFPIALGIVGWMLGWVVVKLLPRLSN